MSARRRFRFGEFTLSPGRRILLRGESEVPLIPRYFDLLLLLVERRNEAVSREEIFDHVWNDVVVSDGALTQAVRSLRRSLGDDAREPRFIRTVSRHGYRFVGSDVREEEDITLAAPTRDELAAALALLEKAASPPSAEEEGRLLEAAEIVLRAGGNDELSNLENRDLARALLREARWEVKDAAPVPIFGRPGGLASALLLLRLRIRRAARPLRRRVAGAIFGGAAAGFLAGLAGGLILRYGRGSVANGSVLVALPLVGLAAGGLGALGVGCGLVVAEASFRSRRGLALVLSGAAGGGLLGALAHFIGRYAVEGLFGRDLSPVGGGVEGLVLGAAVGAGYALATPRREGGMATARGLDRFRTALIAGAVTSLAGLLLSITGRHLGAMSLDLLAHSFPGSQVSLDPLARLLHEPHSGVLTRSVISSFEGLAFGFGVVFGLTGRPRRGRPSMVE
ncbi:MAG: winged helix-turn-helix domain-containing protein [Vicinamibacteria bacterium]